MAILLGVDTGGTYTDAVLTDGDRSVIATAKSLTTRHDLAQGIGRAVSRVLDQSATRAGDIALCALSTTLATNALVEGRGTRICLVFIGFTEKDIARQGLDTALKGDPVICIGGGHHADGQEAAAFDAAALQAGLAALDVTVSGFAVAGQFATRNPAHEIAARDILRRQTGIPVTCSFELSARLGGPRRAMTAVLNARLIGLIDGLIDSAETHFTQIGITAPLMVVRGDGALISSAAARQRPIETILSGPAASIIGARWLTRQDNAIISDIGGTTTDVAVLRDGRPAIDPEGARVGGFRTMVEAVAMRTSGLGGDSEVGLGDGTTAELTLGPRRLVPLALAARDWPGILLPALERQCNRERRAEHDGRFVLPQPGTAPGTEDLNPRETALIDRLGGQPMEMGELVRNRPERAALDRLVSRGLVMLCGLTPSDAAHVLGLHTAWNSEAARLGAEIFSRRRDGAGRRIAADAAALCEGIVAQLTEQTATLLLETAFEEDTPGFGLPAAELARHVLTRRGLDGHRGLLALDTALNLPVIGLGASAPVYYGAVGHRLRSPMILPEHAGVANAIGAVVGQVSIRRRGVVTAQGEGRFRAHLASGAQDFTTADQAIEALAAALTEEARQEARKTGAQDIRTRLEREVKEATVENRAVLVEATLTAIASGRPRIARG